MKRTVLHSVLFEFYIGAWPYVWLSHNIVCMHYIIILIRYIKKKDMHVQIKLYKFSIVYVTNWSFMSLLFCCAILAVFSKKTPLCSYAILQHAWIYNIQF